MIRPCKICERPLPPQKMVYCNDECKLEGKNRHNKMANKERALTNKHCQYKPCYNILFDDGKYCSTKCEVRHEKEKDLIRKHAVMALFERMSLEQELICSRWSKISFKYEPIINYSV